ncbi:MAG: hypothetical protein ACRD7E_14985 [Bryobacteraceae bacterium]
MDSGGSSLWLTQVAMIIFAVVLVVVFAMVTFEKLAHNGLARCGQVRRVFLSFGCRPARPVR